MTIQQISVPRLQPMEFMSPDDSLIVRQLVTEDAGGVYELIINNHDHLAGSWFVDGKQPPESAEAVAEKLANPPVPMRGILCFGVIDGASLVGRIDVIPRKDGKVTEAPSGAEEAEISFFVSAQSKGQAIARRAAEIVMRGMSERFGIDKFTAEVNKNNPLGQASVSSLTNTGFLQLPDTDNDYWMFRRKYPAESDIKSAAGF